MDEHMFSTVDYDGALLFPVRIHFQFPARHFSFITLITRYHRWRSHGDQPTVLTIEESDKRNDVRDRIKERG